jgi:hypothetical protein
METQEAQDPILDEVNSVHGEVRDSDQAKQIQTQEAHKTQPRGQGETASRSMDAAEQEGETPDPREKEEDAQQSGEISLREPGKKPPRLGQAQKEKSRVPEDPFPPRQQFTYSGEDR